ncbi:unnamed protein product [Moneuplotes crassus]|uniref:Uncharacterized protein n=1 Tax=Euplotes crassus TaxID=5936 RepID=A0AAD1XUZ9_EUPCR|nr:unnamed protein product [Moneuplotes crassus]
MKKREKIVMKQEEIFKKMIRSRISRLLSLCCERRKHKSNFRIILKVKEKKIMKFRGNMIEGIGYDELKVVEPVLECGRRLQKFTRIMKPKEIKYMDFRGDSLINSSRYTDGLHFSDCMFDSKGMKIKDNIVFKTTLLSLEGCGKESTGNWTVNTSQIPSFFHAISNSGLSKSLKRIELGKCNLTSDQVQHYIESSFLGGVIVSFQQNSTNNSYECTLGKKPEYQNPTEKISKNCIIQ